MQGKLAILLSRKLSGEATPAELRELEDWIKDHPEDHYLIDSIQSYWQHSNSRGAFNVSDNDHFERILNQAEAPVVNLGRNAATRKKSRRWGIKWAAAAVLVSGLIIAAVVLRQHYFRPIGTVKNDIVTTKGTKTRVILPDGTKVWLNAATHLHFDKKFAGALREVYLDGEAFFDVARDKKRPFIVHTSDIDIRVLGTAFNVKSYKEESTIEATLIHGSIQVSAPQKEGISRIMLNPNEKLVFNKLAGNVNDAAGANRPLMDKPQYLVSKIPIVGNNDSTIMETAWVYNRLLFDGDSFKQLAVKMERWFDVQIKFKTPEVANYRLRGSFEDETIEEAMKALQQIASFKFSVKEKTVTISK